MMKGKRHTTQNSKQRLGQYYTQNASELLSGFEPLIKGKSVIDPFAGNWDLLTWAKLMGAKDVYAFDKHPVHQDTIEQDTIIDPPNFEGKFLLSNPPYLSRNKNKEKTQYDRWGQDDLYKCHLAALYPTCQEGILILPSNFISESRSSARKMFFRNFSINKMKYFYYQVFPNATTGIVVFSFIKDQTPTKIIDTEIHYKDKIVQTQIILEEKYGYLFGGEFFDYINDPDPLKIIKFDEASSNPPNTNIVIGLLSYGTYSLGAHYNEGEPLVCGKKSFTTYQINTSVPLSEQEQREVVRRYNDMLQKFIEKYYGLFLANYMGAEQKIKSRHFSNMLLSKVIKTIKGIETETLDGLF